MKCFLISIKLERDMVSKLKKIRGLGRLLTEGGDTHLLGNMKVFPDVQNFIDAVLEGFDLIIDEKDISKTEIISVKYKPGTYERMEWPKGTFIEYNHFGKIKHKIDKIGKTGHCWKVPIKNKQKDFIFICLPF